MTMIYFLLLLSVIIVIHEAGHLIAAKKFGVYCYEFSFGMGPVIWKKKCPGSVTWSVMVSMSASQPSGSSPKQEVFNNITAMASKTLVKTRRGLLYL